MLRIDDTDQARNDSAHVDLIHLTMSTLGLTPDQVFHQSDRRDQHLLAANMLLDTGWAVRDGSAIRLAPQARRLTPDNFFDLASGVCSLSSTLIDHADSLVLVRSDGAPTYHFASIVDDIDNQINLILRGMDHLSNVGKQVLIARALAQANYPLAKQFCQTIVFAHVGLIMKNNKKLSKRDDSSNLISYLDNKTPPGALLQWAMKLGWGHPDSTFDKQHPLIRMDDMPNLFSQGGLRASNCNLNTDTLDSLNRKWMR